jgi:hypothetical protein
MTSPSDIKLYSDTSKSLQVYDVLSRNFDDVKLKPVSARLAEVVFLRTMTQIKRNTYLIGIM